MCYTIVLASVVLCHALITLVYWFASQYIGLPENYHVLHWCTGLLVSVLVASELPCITLVYWFASEGIGLPVNYYVLLSSTIIALVNCWCTIVVALIH